MISALAAVLLVFLICVYTRTAARGDPETVERFEEYSNHLTKVFWENFKMKVKRRCIHRNWLEHTRSCSRLIQNLFRWKFLILSLQLNWFLWGVRKNAGAMKFDQPTNPGGSIHPRGAGQWEWCSQVSFHVPALKSRCCSRSWISWTTNIVGLQEKVEGSAKSFWIQCCRRGKDSQGGIKVRMVLILIPLLSELCMISIFSWKSPRVFTRTGPD